MKMSFIKKIVLVAIGVIVLYSCGSDDSDDMVIIENEMMETVYDISGNFMADTHPTSGLAKVDSERTKLKLENFKTDKGPNLDMYLSTDSQSTEFVNLGDLKGVDGNYEYSIPANTDLSKFKYVVVWCVDFSVGFGYAELK